MAEIKSQPKQRKVKEVTSHDISTASGIVKLKDEEFAASSQEIQCEFTWSQCGQVPSLPVPSKPSFGGPVVSDQCEFTWSQCEQVPSLPGLARGIVSNRGSSGRDRATTRCAGEHAMASKVRLEI